MYIQDFRIRLFCCLIHSVISGKREQRPQQDLITCTLVGTCHSLSICSEVHLARRPCVRCSDMQRVVQNGIATQCQSSQNEILIEMFGSQSFNLIGKNNFMGFFLIVEVNHNCQIYELYLNCFQRLVTRALQKRQVNNEKQIKTKIIPVSRDNHRQHDLFSIILGT